MFLKGTTIVKQIGIKNIQLTSASESDNTESGTHDAAQHYQENLKLDICWWFDPAEVFHYVSDQTTKTIHSILTIFTGSERT